MRKRGAFIGNWMLGVPISNVLVFISHLGAFICQLGVLINNQGFRVDIKGDVSPPSPICQWVPPNC